MNRSTLVKVFKEDNNYQHFDVIKRNRNKRHQFGEFFVEGVRNINEAVKNGWEIKSLLYSKGNELSNWAKEIIRSNKARGLFELSDKLMQNLSGKEDTSELLAIMKMKNDDVQRIKLNESPLVVIFDRPSNKGNLGTIIRSCDALNCDGLIITGHSVDLYDPATIVASMGSFFKLPTIRIPSNNEIILWIDILKRRFGDVQIVGTSAHGELMITENNYVKPTILIIGNETDGLSRNYKEICDYIVRIPIVGSASSLNVSCAASIFLYEIYRQRSLKSQNFT